MLFAQPFPAEAAALSEQAVLPVSSWPVSSWIESLRKRIAMWATTCADYHGAAALYDELRGLSDAELQRRGMSRDTLARDVCAACDRAACR
jgi:hypothetical protein